MARAAAQTFFMVLTEVLLYQLIRHVMSIAKYPRLTWRSSETYWLSNSYHIVHMSAALPEP